jgi:hypothetical protein
MKVPSPYRFQRPKFVHSKCCGKCPSSKGTDPESEDIMTWPFYNRMRTAFACAWRPEGYCRANYLEAYFGKPYADLDIK